MNNFLKAHDHTPALKAAFPFFDTLPADEREELRKAWERKDRVKLVQKYGLDADSSNINSNSRVSPQ